MVDIIDLSYVYNNLGNIVKDVKIIDTHPIIDINNLSLDEYDDTTINGDIENLFNESEVLSFSKTDEINDNNPLEIGLNFNESIVMNELVFESPLNGAGIKSGYISVEDENGQIIEVPYGNKAAKTTSTAILVRNLDGVIRINLGKQIAVKKVSIIVTETTSSGNLAQISTVKFLNNTEDKVLPPEMNIPSISLTSLNEEIKVKWAHENNVTGYEVKAVGNIKGEEKEMLIQTTSNTVSFKGLDNFNEYKISIQSLNGEWSSGYSDYSIGIPKPTSKPEAPEGINIEGTYKGLNIKWKKHKNANIFNLYYREVDSTDAFIEIKGLTGTSYELNDLKESTKYEVYMTASNDLGTSVNSNMYLGETKNVNPPITPNYKLINTFNEGNEVTDHIVDVEYPCPDMIQDYDENFNKFCIVDGDYTTAWTINDWDTSVYGKTGPIVTFDKEYTIDTISLICRLESNYTLPYRGSLGVWNNDTNSWEYVDFNIAHRNNNGKYALLTLDSPVTSNKFQINISVYGKEKANISELKFYNYDDIEDEVSNLFTDELQIELVDYVTNEKIEKLRKRVNTLDEVSGEYHPNRNVILEELKLVEDILNDKNLSKNVFTLNQNISNSGTNLGMVNDHQALGISVQADEEIVVYVGTTGNVLPELYFTQHYAESDKYIKSVKLKKGKNIIQVPKINNMDIEAGGSVYVRYPNSTPSNNPIKIRVSGGVEVPHLNLYGIINNESDEEIKSLLKDYINNLKDYVKNLPSEYKDNKRGYKYDKNTSTLNTSDIELDKVTLNIPATAVLEGITKGTANEEEQVQRLLNTVKAFEQIMDLKYAERGVSDEEGTESIHLSPRSRLNIKYQRMFIGAFMYASSHHVGIEYNSSSELFNSKPYIFNEDGTVSQKGDLFGWGIAHEIGHVTEISKLTYVETTNNIIALLAQTLDDESPSRLESSNKYEDIYTKVTSGTIGLPSDVFVKLGMFWQLHLGYDNDYTSKMLTSPSFYSKLSRRYREATSEENKLSTEQLLIRLASEVVEKDLSDFFYSWGIRADEETLQYLEDKGYEKETRKIQYLNDQARRKVLNNIGAMNKNTKVEASYENIVGNTSSEKEVTINLDVDTDLDKILGYEIYRNGELIGFTTENTFTDTLGSFNNRTVKYDVIAYDNYLNTTEKFTLDEFKITHDGTLSKEHWSIETNTTNEEDKNDSDITHGPVLNPSINKAIDNKIDTIYKGFKNGNEDPYVTINMNTKQPIVGIRYKDNSDYSIEEFEIYVSVDNENWILATKGNFNDNNEVYFNENASIGSELITHNATYVKVVAKNSDAISVGEIDIIAPAGDNIEIGTEEGNYANGIGILKSDYIYDSINGEYIPKGSIIITGEYRGNPAYNVALLRDENNNIISGEQVLLADIPEGANINEISKGSYIYWIDPKDKELLTSKIKLELYRVNNAITNEGQRLVSDTLYYDIPEKFDEIVFEGSKNRDLNSKIYRKVDITDYEEK